MGVLLGLVVTGRVSKEVLERLQQVFSDTVGIPSERLNGARLKWRCPLIGKFLGKHMDSDFIAKALEF